MSAYRCYHHRSDAARFDIEPTLEQRWGQLTSLIYGCLHEAKRSEVEVDTDTPQC